VNSAAGETYRKILLIHFGQMGDAVQGVPAARALRQRFPRSEFWVLASPAAAEIYRLAGFSQFIVADRPRWKRRPLRAVPEIFLLLERVRGFGFDLSVDLHSLKETNLLAWMAAIPHRVAMVRPTRSLASLINMPPPPDDPHGVLLDRYCRVLEPLGIQVTDRVPRLGVPEAAAAFAAAALPASRGRVLGIVPGAGNPGRRWPADRFAAVATRLMTEQDVEDVAVFLGPEEDERSLAPLLTLRSAAASRLAGAAAPGGPNAGDGQRPTIRRFDCLPIPRLAAALQRCRIVLTNATGPSHIAAAVGARVVSIGEIPIFDPVAEHSSRVTCVRAPDVITNVTVEQVFAAVVAQWTATS
jgi:heptosyltransferase-2